MRRWLVNMATTIDGVALATGGRRTRHSALRLAVTASRRALERTGRKPNDIDLLINAGLYRDRNLGEPALAPLIQHDVGLNPRDPHPGEVGTFSFDVANGGCGVLTALQIADGFLRSKTIRTALVVTSDADPGHGLAPDFPFSPSGGALVCQWTETAQGLGTFHWHDSPDDDAVFSSAVGLEQGHNILRIREDPAFAERVGGVAAVAAGEVLADHALSGGDVDLVVASPARPGFIRTLSTRLEIPEEQIVTAGPELHTAAFVVALELAIRTGRLSAANTVLFVCGAAGLTAGAALYRP
jgi:3-oxoacyl-[acyl-carrier-protein] synthase III